MSIKLKSSVLWSVVLYVDIRDFTLMTINLGEQETLNQVKFFYEIVDECITRFDGWVNNKMGDGVLCFFGFGIQNNRWKEKAVQAALAIQYRLSCSSKIKFTAGIGISSGKVANDSNIFIGDPINLAARLSSVASGGQVLISENSYLTSKVAHKNSDLIPIRLKGFARKKFVYDVNIRTCTSLFEGFKSYG